MRLKIRNFGVKRSFEIGVTRHQFAVGQGVAVVQRVFEVELCLGGAQALFQFVEPIVKVLCQNIIQSKIPFLANCMRAGHGLCNGLCCDTNAATVARGGEFYGLRQIRP